MEIGLEGTPTAREPGKMQLVLDLDNTLVHVARHLTDKRHRQRLFQPAPGEHQTSLFRVWKRRSGTAKLDMYDFVYRFSFRSRLDDLCEPETHGYIKLRPFLFEAISTMKAMSDIHIYSKGSSGYVHAALTLLFGALNSRNEVVTGRVMSKCHDLGNRKKDLRLILSPSEIDRAVIVDDQPAVWQQVGAVLATPPYFEFAEGVNVSDDDRVTEIESRYLLVAASQVQQIGAFMKEQRVGAMLAMWHLRKTLLQRLKLGDGRLVSILVPGLSPVESTKRETSREHPPQHWKHLHDMVVHHGGSVACAPSDGVTHVVSDNAEGIEWAARCGSVRPHAVGVRWLVDTLMYLHPMNELRYLLDGATISVQAMRTEKVQEMLLAISYHQEEYFAANRHREYELRQLTKTVPAVAALVAVLAALNSIPQWRLSSLLTIAAGDPCFVAHVPLASPFYCLLSRGDVLVGFRRQERQASTAADDLPISELFSNLRRQGPPVLHLTVTRNEKASTRAAGLNWKDVPSGVNRICVTIVHSAATAAVSAAVVVAAAARCARYVYRALASAEAPVLQLSDHLLLLGAPAAAEALTACCGMQLVAVNGAPVRDIVDYHRIRARQPPVLGLLFRGEVIKYVNPLRRTLTPPPRPAGAKRKRDASPDLKAAVMHRPPLFRRKLAAPAAVADTAR